MTEAELLAAIVAAPGDADARAVYADWLEERGDPRGECLRLEALLHAGPARLRALRSALDPAWLASVTRHHDVMLFAGGHDKIAVIERVREVAGLGLKDAKDLVEGTPRAPGGATRAPARAGGVVDRDCHGTTARGDPQRARRAGLGLAEAKALIDAVVGGERRSLMLEGRPEDLAERVAHLRRTCHVEI